jgi:hypothetical protein
MSERSWKPDPALTRPSHDWVFIKAVPHSWGLPSFLPAKIQAAQRQVAKELSPMNWAAASALIAQKRFSLRIKMETTLKK